MSLIESIVRKYSLTFFGYSYDVIYELPVQTWSNDAKLEHHRQSLSKHTISKSLSLPKCLGRIGTHSSELILH